MVYNKTAQWHNGHDFPNYAKDHAGRLRWKLFVSLLHKLKLMSSLRVNEDTKATKMYVLLENVL